MHPLMVDAIDGQLKVCVADSMPDAVGAMRRKHDDAVAQRPPRNLLPPLPSTRSMSCS